eukprot:g5197.t1
MRPLHPQTYLNKVLVGSAEGELQLWNVRSCRRVHTFGSIKSLVRGASITAIANSLAIDVVAVGTSTGRVIVLNIREDVVLSTFSHAKEDGGVTTLSFRSDEGGIPLLVSGSGTGSIAFWDLAKSKLHSKLERAHDCGVTSAVFLPRQPVLVTAGRDNAVKQWLLDKVDGTARLLRSRQGHMSPPTCVRFYGGTTIATPTDGVDSAKNCQLLSGGSDRSLRLFHTARPEQTSEFSQGSVQKLAKRLNATAQSLKLPPIRAIASSEAKNRFWGNVVTAHESHAAAYVWSTQNKRLCDAGKQSSKRKRALSLCPGEDKFGHVTCVAISQCGHMALLGTRSGAICKYNLQSGRFRGTIEGHVGDVTGVAVGELNRTVVSVALDSTIRFSKLKASKTRRGVDAVGRIEKPDEAVELPSSGARLAIHRDASLVAVACDDFQVRAYD